MKIVLLGSGKGSNAKAILDAYTHGLLGLAEPIAIISDQAEAPILSFGPQFGIPSHFLSAAPFKTKLAGEAEHRYITKLQEYKPDLIILAGFMRVLKPPLLKAFSDQIINLHPSLLPAFKGLNAIEQAFNYGVRYTGCTVHWVSPEVDAGRIIGQSVVPILARDTLESVTQKVHAAEHELLPKVIKQLSLTRQSSLPSR